MSVATKVKTASRTPITEENLDDFLAGGQVAPVHPGELFRDAVVKSRGLSATAVAGEIGVSRNMLYKIFNGQSAVTAATAIGMGMVAGNDPEIWLRAQFIWDLWHERERRAHRPELAKGLRHTA